jgi:hypothetical protein
MNFSPGSKNEKIYVKTSFNIPLRGHFWNKEKVPLKEVQSI